MCSSKMLDNIVLSYSYLRLAGVYVHGTFRSITAAQMRWVQTGSVLFITHFEERSPPYIIYSLVYLAFPNESELILISGFGVMSDYVWLYCLISYCVRIKYANFRELSHLPYMQKTSVIFSSMIRCIARIQYPDYFSWENQSVKLANQGGKFHFIAETRNSVENVLPCGDVVNLLMFYQVLILFSNTRLQMSYYHMEPTQACL